MLASPVYTANGTENCYNKTVEKIIKHATKEGKKMVKNQSFPNGVIAILDELNKYKDIDIQTKRSTCISPAIIKAEHLAEGWERGVLHNLNGFMSEIINNYDNIEAGTTEPLPEDFNTKLIEKLGFGFDPKMLTKNTNAAVGTYFAKRWSWYNQSVNFEHVCFIIACILTNKVNFVIEYAEQIIFPFLFFIKKYSEDKQLLQYFMYHMMKFIRVYHTRAIGDKQKFWNPVVYMTNLGFGSYIDPNVEIYGNVRLSRNPKEIMSMFSNAPRSTGKTSEQVIWLNWNEVTPIIGRFSQESENIWLTFFRNSPNTKAHTDIIEFFKFLTVKDILPRYDLAKNGFINLYHRCVAEAEKEVSEEDLIELMTELLIRVGATEYTPGRRFANAKIGITYFKGEHLESKVLDITLDKLSNRLNSKPKSVENVSLYPYIVKCSFTEKGNIVRKEFSTCHDNFNELLAHIEATRKAIRTL